MPEPSSAGPVELSERVHLLDALRGFALLGVFVSNSLSWFSGRSLLPNEQAQALAAPMLEAVVRQLYAFFVDQKFVTLFSLLFGMGFALQMTRAEGRGTSIVPVYRRRLLVLLGIGLVHMFALWVGDILSTYALVGFVLLLFRQRSDRTVLTWVAVLFVVLPLTLSIAQRFGPELLHGKEAAEAAAKATRDLEAAHRTAFLTGLSSESVLTSQKANALFAWQNLPNPGRPIWLCIILGRFLLGLWTGRQKLLEDVERHRKLLVRVMSWGLGVGSAVATLSLVLYLRSRGTPGGPWGQTSQPPWMVGMRTLREVGYLFMGCGYAAAFALLFQKERWRKVLGVLTPAGRMALTLYLTQSVISIALYDGWGLGLVGHTPPSRTVLMCLGVFAAQVAFSHWWLARFRFGPVEWLWRSLTYGRLQPMRLAPAGEARAAH
ncbi:DUF418 domain-containing protein [Corallococcus exiguus]|uniref:DUF418 domain-containing protein n=1 Tax=Corallococcus TaxID=83461 RepID=UPI000EB99323|nr:MULTISPECIES: DUF418 domain-containing protein [Corallococcus]NRD60767.1 DUF418 domain-containing protein [Corallococcus exiguus]RKI08751.1 DUF418 domain-containing protein [Corallococcus sp. AB030]RUO90738.1 DUF418 domain-containing protein [Corallococcus sp. AB018]